MKDRRYIQEAQTSGIDNGNKSQSMPKLERQHIIESGQKNREKGDKGDSYQTITTDNIQAQCCQMLWHSVLQDGYSYSLLYTHGLLVNAGNLS